MVVLAASIVTKSGKVLISRQYTDMPRTRIEGLLAAFPKLVGTDEKQHTYFETENVRFVYQPVEAITYLVLITNKQSNIWEDLDTLRVLSKVLENSYSLDEAEICTKAFELIFAFDEIICLGHKENVTLAQVKQFCSMESDEEKLQKLAVQRKINETKDVMRHKAIEIYKSKVSA